MGGSCREELKIYSPTSSAVLWVVNVSEKKHIEKKKMFDVRCLTIFFANAREEFYGK